MPMVLILEKTRPGILQNCCFNIKKLNEYLLNEKNTKDGLTQKRCSPMQSTLKRFMEVVIEDSSQVFIPRSANLTREALTPSGRKDSRYTGMYRA